MDAWTFIWLMFLLKIPIVGLLLLVRWAVRQEPLPAAGSEEDGGICAPVAPVPGPTHPRPRLPRTPRRGPHGGRPPHAPSRMRPARAASALTARGRHSQP